MSDPVTLHVPLIGTSDETILMAALDYVISQYQFGIGAPLTDESRARAAAWLASKYRLREKHGKFIEGVGWVEWTA